MEQQVKDTVRSDEGRKGVGRFDPSATVMTSKKAELSFSCAIAILIWMGLIHIVFCLFVLSIVLLPSVWGYTLFGLLVVLTVIPIDSDGEWGNRLAEFVCHHVKGYFPVTVVVEDMEAFNPKKAYVFAVEPHSILPLGIQSLCKQMGFLPLPKIKALGSSAIFYTPILRQVWTWLGLIPATRKNFIRHLNSGYSCIVIPGGMQEVFYMMPQTEVAYLKRRHGFVRIAIETGSPLVPVFNFGQTNAFSWWRPKGSLYAHVCKVIRCAPLLFWGHYCTPLPHRVPLHIVVGRPIEVKKNPQPSSEEVLAIHDQYASAIQELYEKHKVAAGYKDIPLKIL